MSGSFDFVADSEFWSLTDFAQGSDFTFDTEFVGPRTDGLFDIVDLDAEDDTLPLKTPRSCQPSRTSQTYTPPRRSQICNGPRLLPRIRDQDQALQLAAPTKHEISKSCPRPNTPLAQNRAPGKTVQSSDLIANNELCDNVTQKLYTQEQFQEITPPPPGLESTSSRPGPYTPEGYNNSFSSINGSFSASLYDPVNDLYLSQDFANFPLYDEHYDSSPTSKPLKPILSEKAIHPKMYPSSHPRPVQALTQDPYQSLYQIPPPISIGQSTRANTASKKQTTLLQYLSLPNPASATVALVQEPGEKSDPHYWWDARNVRDWSAFKFETMLDVPELRSLLHSGVPCDTLPTPRSVPTTPFVREHLRFAYMVQYGTKLNAALRLSSVQPSLQMRSNPGGQLETPPDFISSASTSQEQRTPEDSRVVGMVLCYEQWNSSMRWGDRNRRIKCLHGLARLQAALRQHQCRYGFIITEIIITEIEIVCVRYGGDDIIAQQVDTKYGFSHITSGHFIPIFGYFEVSAAVRLSHNHLWPSDHDGPDWKPGMTAGLALWYLHMHARDVPLPGQLHWKINVGTAIALTRQKHLPTDSWVPKPLKSEDRQPKRLRGWFMPHEGLNRSKEIGKNKSTVTGKRKSRG